MTIQIPEVKPSLMWFPCWVLWVLRSTGSARKTTSKLCNRLRWVSWRCSAMQLALAAVYFILPADGVIPPAASDLLTDGSTVFQLSPGETNKYDFLLGENISEIFGERWWVMVVMASWSRLLTPANSHLQPIKAERNLVLQGAKTTAFNQQWASYATWSFCYQMGINILSVSLIS